MQSIQIGRFTNKQYIKCWILECPRGHENRDST